MLLERSQRLRKGRAFVDILETAGRKEGRKEERKGGREEGRKEGKEGRKEGKERKGSKVGRHIYILYFIYL